MTTESCATPVHDALIDDVLAARRRVIFGILETLLLDARLIQNVHVRCNLSEIGRLFPLDALVRQQLFNVVLHFHDVRRYKVKLDVVELRQSARQRSNGSAVR